MVEKKCSKCGEMVDEAKAFCPGCGNAVVEEKKRASVSEFDLSDHTVRLGDSMYNQMLSDMGLSISKQPNRDDAHDKPTVQISLSGRPRTGSTDPVGGSKTRTVVLALVVLLGVIMAIVIAAVLLVYFR